MNRQAPIREIMTASVTSVQFDEPLAKVVDIFKKKKIRHLPVLQGASIVGIISASDVNRLTFGALLDHQDSSDEAILEMLNITQVMSSKPRLVKSSDSVEEVAEIFVGEKVHSLPVVEGEELVGIVTTTDVIRFFLRD